MAFENSYRFLLDGVVVYPLIGNELNYDYEKFEESFSFRKKLNSKIKFQGDDYDNIEAGAIDYQFIFEIQKYDGSGWVEDFLGYFYKTDCKFNKDNKILEVTPVANDGYDDIKKALNNSYNLIELSPSSISVTIKVRPVLQIIVKTPAINVEDRITNIIGTSTWEEVLTDGYSESELLAFGFSKITKIGEGTAYTSADFYRRYLTPDPSFGTNPTSARLENDISSVAPSFKYTSIDVVSGGEIYFGGVQDLPTKWGKTADTNFPVCVPKIDKYFLEYPTVGSGFVVPVNRAHWVCDSYWYLILPSINQYEIDNSIDQIIEDNYLISDVIQLLLSQNTDIVHENTSDFSQILYGTNPLGQEFTAFLTPKSNIINYFYTQPARKASITLNDILYMYQYTMNIYWFIEVVSGEKRLRLEHISWFENGGTYGSQSVDLDLTQQADPRTGLPYSYYQNEYDYNKINMPYRYEYLWMDDVSQVFEGHPINVISNQVEPGNIKKIQVGNFSSDIDFIVSNTGISLDGFCLLLAELDGGVYKAPYVDLNISGSTYAVQNGLAAFTYLIETYLLYGLPTPTVEIDGVVVAALSVTRNKQQEIEFAIVGQEIDPLKLITTELGSGQVDKMTINIINFKFKLFLNHDTE